MTGPKTGGRSLLLPRIAKREWDVVAQLAFQILNKNVEGAADELLNMIIQHFERAEGEVKWILLSFAARCLEFLVPSPRIARKITLSSLQLSMSLGEKAKIVGGPIPEADKESRWVLGSLLDSSSENWSPISDCIENFVKTCYSQENETRAAVAVEVAFSLGMARQSTLRSLSREKGSRQ